MALVTITLRLDDDTETEHHVTNDVTSEISTARGTVMQLSSGPRRKDSTGTSGPLLPAP
jgi:hypothetical protein